jgi:hypothetical protein
LRSLAAAAAALSVLAPLLSPSSSPLPLLVAEAAVVPGPFGDHAVVSAPAGYFAAWEGNQLFPDTGFCLSESEGRVLQNWSSPLYQRRIVVATEGGPGMSMVSAHGHSARGHAGRGASEREDGATRLRRPVPSSPCCSTAADDVHAFGSLLCRHVVVPRASAVAVMSLLLQLWAWIVKILLQEVVGHQVWWYDAGSSTDTFYNRLVLDAPDRRSDIEIQSYLQPAAPTEDYRTNISAWYSARGWRKT